MPATYAHYSFGRAVTARLNGEEKRIIRQNEQLFNIGLHGPDILFYYRPVIPNKVSRTGYSIHGKAGAEFFKNAADVVCASEAPEAYLAYIYGFICHFALDRACHGYIDCKTAQGKVTHIEIEGEFDRALLLENGFDPVSKRICGHITVNDRSAKIISRFFDGITPKQISKALHSYKFYCGLFLAPGKFKRGAINAALKICGLYKSLHGMMMNKQADPECEDSSEKLRKLFDEAVGQAVLLIEEFKRSALNERPWNDLYSFTFGSEYVKDDKDEKQL